ncbi:MAG: GerMN domain-containing protein [Acidimicrobiales bacterium]
MRRRPPVVVALVATLVGLLAGACGIPLDDAPRAVVASSTTTAPGTATTVQPGDTTAFLFFIADNHLIDIDQEIPSRQPRDVLSALFAGVPAGSSADVVSQIPTGTRLLDVRQNGNQLDVDVSKEFDNLVGAGRTQATAQIVLTATDLNGVDQVALLIDGQQTQVFSPVSGDSDRVGACDYLNLFPTDDLLQSWPLDRKAQRHLTTRRNMLSEQCGTTPTAGN